MLRVLRRRRARPLLAHAALRSTRSHLHPSRHRQASTRRSAAVVALAGLGLAAFAALYAEARREPRQLRRRHFGVTIPNLPAALDGLRIAFLSDFHLHGPGDDGRLTERAFAIVAQERPEMVFLGGDFFDHAGWQRDGKALAGLRAIEAPIFAVLGNHDFRGGQSNASAIADILRQYGVTVLRNQSTTTHVRGVEVVISGVDDPYIGEADLDAALREAAPARPLVLLAHAPTLADDMPVATAGLVLTGHTHGGQIRLSPSSTLTPLDISFYLDRLYGRPLTRYQRGFHWVRGSLLYVTNGIGMTRWPLRLFSLPEVVLMELTTHGEDPSKPCDCAERYVRELD